MRGGEMFGDISLPSTSGSRIGISASQKLAFYGSTPIVRPTDTPAAATGSGAKNLIDAQVGGVSKFKVTNGGMPELGVAGEGIVMKSPDGTRYKVTVANGGTIAVAAA